MAKRKQYVVQGQTYKTQKELEARVKWALNSHKLDCEFEDQFLAAVVNELHQDVIKAGQRATKFIYLSWEEQIRRNMPTAIRFRGGQLLMAYFKPLNEWRDVTVYPWRQLEQHQNNTWKWLCKYHHRHVSLMSPINNKTR